MPLLGPGLWLVAALALDGKVPTYERDVRPILVRRCVPCHSARHLDDRDTGGDLALETFESARKGTNKHRVVVPGAPGESPLFARLADEDEDRRMPPDEERLDAATRDLIRRWIDDGAPRGEPISVKEKSGAKPAARRVVRSIDVTIPLPSKDAAAAIRVKAGPLPAVSSLAFGSDGKVLAVGTHGQVTLWDLAKRAPIRVLDDVTGPVPGLAMSPDGTTLAVGSGLPARSGSIRLYAIPEGSFLRALDGHRDVVSAVAFRPDGKALASSSYDGTVRTWDVASGKPVGVFKGHSDFVYDVAYLPDGRSLLSSSKDRTIKRIDAATMAEMRTYGEHNDDVLALATRPDGSFLSAGNEPAIRAWALDAEKSSKRLGAHSGPVFQIAASRDGKRVASASGDGSIRVFVGPDLGSPRTLPGPTEWQYAVAVSPDGRRVAGGGWDGLVRVWDADAAKLETILVQPPSLNRDDPSWLAIAADGSVAGSDDLRAAVRWVVGGKETKRRPKSK